MIGISSHQIFRVVPNTFYHNRRHLRSTTEQTHGNIDSIRVMIIDVSRCALNHRCIFKEVTYKFSLFLGKSIEQLHNTKRKSFTNLLGASLRLFQVSAEEAKKAEEDEKILQPVNAG